jgi:hypothetical protein
MAAMPRVIEPVALVDGMRRGHTVSMMTPMRALHACKRTTAEKDVELLPSAREIGKPGRGADPRGAVVSQGEFLP